MPAARLRLVFAGTPDFAVPGLRACLDTGAEVVAVYTQPDRPAGRGRKLAPSPVKQATLAVGIPVEQPESLKTHEAQARLRAYAPDLMVVIAYGLILSRKVLAIPRLGCWNVHASLLPRWRGAAPIQRAILAGDAETGVCLMQMDAGLDTGPVLLERRTAIASDDTGGTLHDRLATLGAEVLREGLQRIAAGEDLTATPQPEVGITYAHKLDKAEAKLDFTQPARELERKVRAFDPWPVAEAELAGERVRVWAASAMAATPEQAGKAPGALVAASKHGIDVACGEGVLRILKLQRAGGRVIGAADYLNARVELRRA
ncbi:MAG: Methionyl-tRNA formyltransferase [Rhodanobacteraceae bacterium]|jgi:methionyl-tRNA formyltransferase|nr:MAG: Methionyl-tRNA formyltransferase [Rhodanobacteraceae bacterium]